MKAGRGMKLANLNLLACDPNKEQFAPTDAQPIRQRARMAGDPVGGYPEAEASAGERFKEKMQEVNKTPPSKKELDAAARTINDSTVGPRRASAYEKAFEK